MQLFLRIVRYIKLHLFRDPRYFFSCVVQYLNPRFELKVSYYSNKEVAKFVEAGKSLIRFGDGEIYLLNHGDIAFEHSVPELRALMNKIIKEYSMSASYVLGLNKIPLQMTNKKLKQKGLLSCWLPSKIYFNLYFNKKATYADAAMFYFRETIPNYFEDYLKTKHVIFVSNKQNCERFIVNNQIQFEHNQVVETPETGAFSEYKNIKTEVMFLVEKFGKDNSVVLAAFGPASKVLAYELSKSGVQVLDVGQGITAAYTSTDHSLSKNIRMLQ